MLARSASISRSKKLESQLTCSRGEGEEDDAVTSSPWPWHTTAGIEWPSQGCVELGNGLLCPDRAASTINHPMQPSGPGKDEGNSSCFGGRRRCIAGGWEHKGSEKAYLAGWAAIVAHSAMDPC
jgi:hypothetical protein